MNWACEVCGRRSKRKRCPKHRGKAQPRRAYSGTALEREVRAVVFEEHGDTCSICGQPGATVLHHFWIAHVDGGPFEPWNLRPAHDVCNKRQGDRPAGAGGDEDLDAVSFWDALARMLPDDAEVAINGDTLEVSYADGGSFEIAGPTRRALLAMVEGKVAA